jgi:hypothetical protein
VQPIELLKVGTKPDRRYGWGIVTLDVSRRQENHSIVFDSANPANIGAWGKVSYPLKSDVANDDVGHANDEDNLPKFGCVYSFDAPRLVSPYVGNTLPGGGALTDIL